MTHSDQRSTESEGSSSRGGEGSSTGVLRRELWPRTVRTALVSALMPWVRGRSRRKQIEQEIAGHGLPRELSELASRTVRATRLWPEERLDVARELCGHFADGVAAGRSEGELIAGFGDPSKAAGLIRSAKVRCRPTWWKTTRWLIRGAAGMVLLAGVSYGYLSYRYFRGTPNLRVNYTAEWNAITRATPAEQRAWPEYVRAVREIGPLPVWTAKEGWPARAGAAHWEDGKAFLHEHAGTIERVRAAAKRPTIGYVLSNVTDPEYMRALEVRSPQFKYLPELEHEQENPALMGVLLPYLGEMRNLSRLLRFDAAVAAEEGDRARFVADMEGILGLAEQALGGRFAIDTMVGIVIGDLAAEVAMERLHAEMEGTKPLLTGEDVKGLAHRFATLGGGRVRLDATIEDKFWEDMLQRVFSDNGSGDGHLIKSAADDLYRDFGVANPTNNTMVKAAMPVMAAFKVSRAEFASGVRTLVLALREDEQLPPWRADERTSDAKFNALYEQNIEPLAIAKSLLGDAPYLGMFGSRDAFETRRAAVETMCAVEMYRRANGHVPGRLEELTPGYLPRVPLDPFDGKPLRYVVKGDGSAARPVLYSIGVDLVDDGGTRPTAAKGGVSNFKLLRLFRHPAAVTSTSEEARGMKQAMGDWVLYPPAERTEKE